MEAATLQHRGQAVGRQPADRKRPNLDAMADLDAPVSRL
jgi:hypothetical protein